MAGGHGGSASEPRKGRRPVIALTIPGLSWAARLAFYRRHKYFGALPDAPDIRDQPLAAIGVRLVSDIPTAASVDQDQPPKNQDGTGSCCGQSIASGVWMAYQALGIKIPELAALFPYFLARCYEGQPVVDDGTSIRNTLKAGARFGFARESDHPMIPSRVNRKPTWTAFRGGYDFRGLRGYYRIPSGDVHGWRRAIASGFPVLAWWKIDKAFKRWSGPEVIGPCDLTQFAGNHAMVVPTYTRDGNFDLLNSWGRWRRNGRQRVTEEFIEQARDSWALDVRK